MLHKQKFLEQLYLCTHFKTPISVNNLSIFDFFKKKDFFPELVIVFGPDSRFLLFVRFLTNLKESTELATEVTDETVNCAF